MAVYEVELEFDWQGRTYRVAQNVTDSGTIYSLSNMREKIVIAKDLVSGESIFVDWSSIAVFRIKGIQD